MLLECLSFHLYTFSPTRPARRRAAPRRYNQFDRSNLISPFFLIKVRAYAWVNKGGDLAWVICNFNPT